MPLQASTPIVIKQTPGISGLQPQTSRPKSQERWFSMTPLPTLENFTLRAILMETTILIFMFTMVMPMLLSQPKMLLMAERRLGIVIIS
jgi:hypothetical protein